MVDVVIRIPDEVYEDVTKNSALSFIYDDTVTSALANGTPLPKGHGRLIDADAITKDFNTFQKSFVMNMDNTSGFKNIVCIASTIIEADKEEQK